MVVLDGIVMGIRTVKLRSRDDANQGDIHRASNNSRGAFLPTMQQANIVHTVNIVHRV